MPTCILRPCWENEANKKKEEKVASKARGVSLQLKKLERSTMQWNGTILNLRGEVTDRLCLCFSVFVISAESQLSSFSLVSPRSSEISFFIHPPFRGYSILYLQLLHQPDRRYAVLRDRSRWTAFHKGNRSVVQGVHQKRSTLSTPWVLQNAACVFLPQKGPSHLMDDTPAAYRGRQSAIPAHF